MSRIIEELAGRPDDVEQVKKHMRSNETAIMVVHRRLFPRIISLQEVENVQFLTLIPFEEATSVAAGTEPRELRVYPDVLPLMSERDNVAVAMQNRLPRLGEFLPVPTHFYGREKNDNNNHPDNSRPLSQYGTRHYFWIEPQCLQNIFFYCPGKWTLASIGAKALTDLIEARLNSGSSKDAALETGRATAAFRVAQRPHLRPATHRLTPTSSGSVFELLPT
jgi:hypothetical protein